MAVTDYSTTPASNVSVNGISIAEGCAAGNINGALRAMMADIKVMYNALPATANYILKDGTVAFTGQPTFTLRGAFLHMNDVANQSARVFTQASGGTAPTMSNGDMLLEYA